MYNDLKHNDVIGLGCGEFILDDMPVKKDEIYVFRLIKKTDVPPSVPIEISDDDEDGNDDDDGNVIANGDKPMISNDIVKTEPGQNATVTNQLVTINSSPKGNEGMADFPYIIHQFWWFSFSFLSKPLKFEQFKEISQKCLQHRLRPMCQRAQLKSMKIKRTTN